MKKGKKMNSGRSLKAQMLAFITVRPPVWGLASWCHCSQMRSKLGARPNSLRTPTSRQLGAGSEICLHTGLPLRTAHCEGYTSFLKFPTGNIRETQTVPFSLLTPSSLLSPHTRGSHTNCYESPLRGADR